MKQISFEEAVTVLSKCGIVFQKFGSDDLKLPIKPNEVVVVEVTSREGFYYTPTTIEHAVFKYVGGGCMSSAPCYTTLQRQELTSDTSTCWKQVSPWVTVEVEE